MSPKAAASEVQVVASIKGTAVVLVDSYPSIPGGMSLCQAGQERFLRVVALSKRPAQETLRVPLESCRDNIELKSGGLEWNAEAATLKVRWLSGPSVPQQPEELTWQLGERPRAAKP